MIDEIKIGDYIEKSELDTEQKYNDVVEVFEQWGFKAHKNHSGFKIDNPNPLSVFEEGYCHSLHMEPRKLTYDQIMSLKKHQTKDTKVSIVNRDIE